MTFDWTLKLGDIAIVLATFLGPIAAIQAQKIVEARREQQQRRVAIFKTLMATRAAMLSPAHVEAINSIPIEFYGKGNKLKQIGERWKNYLDALSQPNPETPTWAQNRLEAFNNLLFQISDFLSFSFTALEIKREVYFPTAHAHIQSDQEIIRQGLARLFKGELSLPMDVKSFPADPTFVENQMKLQAQLLEWLNGQSSVKVEVQQSSAGKGDE